MIKGFSDLPDDLRMEALRQLDAMGAMSAGYVTGGICVALPRDLEWGEIDGWARRFGMEYRKGSMCYFPLGSDKPEDRFRHDGPAKYNGKRGFWLYATFEVQS